MWVGVGDALTLSRIDKILIDHVDQLLPHAVIASTNKLPEFRNSDSSAYDANTLVFIPSASTFHESLMLKLDFAASPFFHRPFRVRCACIPPLLSTPYGEITFNPVYQRRNPP